MKRNLILLLTLCHSTLLIYSQNTTNSPTSMFGLGELSIGEGGQYSGLGGAGIALQSYNFLNTANPASLTAIEGQRFLIDAGVMGAYKVYTQTGTSNHSLVGNLNNLSIGCRITPRWYGAVFMAPVSSVGYAITLDQDITGTGSSTVSSLFEGEGGLSKMGISTAYRLFKGFSVGANLSYVTGTIKQTETQGSISVEESSYKHAFYADFGLQYKFPLSRNKYLVAGAVYGYSQDLAQDNTLSVSSTSGNESIDESQSHVRQCLPQFVGAGLAYNSPRWTLTAEYKYTDWSRMKSSQKQRPLRESTPIVGRHSLYGRQYLPESGETVTRSGRQQLLYSHSEEESNQLLCQCRKQLHSVQRQRSFPRSEIQRPASSAQRHATGTGSHTLFQFYLFGTDVPGEDPINQSRNTSSCFNT